MSKAYSAIDLPNLPAPQSITPVSASQEMKELVQLFHQLYPEFDKPLESDPVYKLMEAFAYRLAIEKQRRNNALKGIMLAYATGADLDQLGANVNVSRLVIQAANNETTPPTPPIMESDHAFRMRIQLSFEQYSTAGSVGSYTYHARSASGDVADVMVTSPSPGTVVIYILSRLSTGSASDDLLQKVYDAVNADDVRPLTDYVTVKTAVIIPYNIAASLEIYPGPDASVVKENAYKALKNYCESVRKIGAKIATSGVYAALQQPGVCTVTLRDWSGDLIFKEGEVGYCSDITLSEQSA